MPEKVLVIGGAGFIGSNVSHFYLHKGCHVTVLDNFCRKGTRDNIKWLKAVKSGTLEVITADIVKDKRILEKAVRNKDVVFHFAGQVAVTTSVTDPRHDFMINAFGTFQVLEAVRQNNPGAVLFYSSTNKVYGGMDDVKIIQSNDRYVYQDFPDGIPENRLLDFHSPYGCSKGSADQYVHDYSRIYGMKTIVFRQSCIYGYRQFGMEDQGWVAWFVIAALYNKKINIYGDGKQVRDVLFIDDLVAAYDKAFRTPEVYGKIFNIGGGKKNTMSLLELIGMIEKFFGRKIELLFTDWRPGDQPVYISDIGKAEKEFGWKPEIGIEAGVDKLARWVQENKDLFKGFI